MIKHVPHFEVLRGVAAIWVLISHVLLIVDIKVPYLSDGNQAVELFVILSGFVITLMVNSEHETYGMYIFRRVVRLYPLFLIALVYGASTDYLYAPVFGHSPWLETIKNVFETRGSNLHSNLWPHLLLHLTMFHGAVPDNILPQANLMFSGPLWSISLEWQFYLIAPFLIFLISFKTLLHSMLSVCLLAVTIFLAFVTEQYWLAEVPSFLPLRLPLFMIGIISATLWSEARETKAFILGAVVLTAFLICRLFSPNGVPLFVWFSVYFAAAAHDKLAVTRFFNTVVSAPVSHFVGRVSYGLYVLHVPTMMLISYYIVIPYMLGAGKIFSGFTIGTLTLGVTLILAHVSFVFIEKPSISWARNRVRSAGARSSALAV